MVAMAGSSGSGSNGSSGSGSGAETCCQRTGSESTPRFKMAVDSMSDEKDANGLKDGSRVYLCSGELDRGKGLHKDRAMGNYQMQQRCCELQRRTTCTVNVRVSFLKLQGWRQWLDSVLQRRCTASCCNRAPMERRSAIRECSRCAMRRRAVVLGSWDTAAWLQ